MALPPGYSVRPATLDDVELVAQIRTQRHPDQPWDAESIAFYWSQERHQHDATRWMVESAGEAVGYLSAVHRRWELNLEGQERWGGVKIDARPGHDAPELLTAVLSILESELEDAEVLKAHARESDPVLIRFFEAAGYVRERLGRWSDLDLVTRGGALAEMRAVSRERMRAQGITITTLDRARAERGEALMRELYEQSNLAEEDVPHSEPYYPAPYQEFLEWMSRSGLHPDRIFIGIGADGSVMGLSMLHYPTVGPPWTDWTFTARHARGRGLARALKLETALQARDLGAERIRTENDGENQPILHLNDEFGYRVIPGELELIKRRVR